MEEQSGEQKEKIIEFKKPDPRIKATADELREEAGPPATRFLKEISAFTNKKYVNGAQMTAVIGLAIVERILMNIARGAGHAPGSEEGNKFIESVYDAAKKDTLLLWGKN